MGARFAVRLALPLALLREGTRGRLPTQLTTGGLAYETTATGATEEALQDLQAQVERIEGVVAALADRLDVPDRRS